MSARRLVAAGLAAVTLLPSPVVAQSPDVAETSTRLRIVVSPPVAPLVDVYLDGEPVPGLTDVATGSVSGYAAIPAGAHQVELFPDGSDPSAGTPITSTPIDVADGDARTLAVAGDGSSMVLDDATVPPAIGASLRVVNLDTDAGPVDAWLGARPLALGLPPEAASMRFVVPAGTDTLTTNAPGDRLSLFASEDVALADGSAITAFMVPTSERAVWFLAVDASLDGRTRSGPQRSDPDALAWRTLPVYECELMVLFTTDGETSSTRRTGSARVRVPASLRGGLALYHYPVTTGGRSADGLGPGARWLDLRPPSGRRLRRLRQRPDHPLRRRGSGGRGRLRRRSGVTLRWELDPAGSSRTDRAAAVASRTQPPSTTAFRARPRAPTTGATDRRATRSAAGSPRATADAMCPGAQPGWLGLAGLLARAIG